MAVQGGAGHGCKYCEVMRHSTRGVRFPANSPGKYAKPARKNTFRHPLVVTNACSPRVPLARGFSVCIGLGLGLGLAVAFLQNTSRKKMDATSGRVYPCFFLCLPSVRASPLGGEGARIVPLGHE